MNFAGLNQCLIIKLTRSIPKPEQICGVISEKVMALRTTHLGDETVSTGSRAKMLP